MFGLIVVLINGLRTSVILTVALAGIYFFFVRLVHCHTHTHTHIYIYIYTYTAKFDGGLKIKYESLAHMWNKWYKAYLSDDEHDDFPRLIVRLEDLVFHGETVVPQICACAGATSRPNFVHSSTVQNQNVGIDTSNVREGLYRSLVRYGTTMNRRKGYPPFQLDAIKEILDPSMMEIFGYPYEEP